MTMRALLVIACTTLVPAAAHAGGDPVAGKKLVQEKKCEDCHHNQTLGDAKAVYLRKDHKVTSLAKLKSQVAACNSQLNLQMFPEDEEDVAAYLNETYYHFPAK